jgi:HSP90 family molecular chaperone/class 3 adenylate cyclase
MTFETKGMAARKMEISLENILPSLAKALYGEDWRVSIRELLQNCHDALIERSARKLDTTEDYSRIDIIPEPGDGTLTFKDNGIGMTAKEVEEHLATVGAGYKRKQLQELADEGKADRSALDRLIGQYGIGFLSSFIIADRVLVRTKSRVDPTAPGVKALFTGETQWYCAEDPNAALGTQVIVQLKREPITDPQTGKKKSIMELLNFENLKREVRRFGDLLPYPIFVYRGSVDPSGDQSNALKGPWEREGFNVREFFDFLKNRHPGENEPLIASPFRLHHDPDKVEAHGLLYFPRAERDVQQPNESLAQVELFCRRMFITSDIPALLPDWASFVGVVVECPDLTPTLSRNDVIRYDAPFIALKEGLGKQITETLKHLAQKQEKAFNYVLNEHRDRLYIALLMDFRDSPKDEEFLFRSIINHVTFSVIHRGAPEGQEMTLPQYRAEFSKSMPQQKEKPKIYYLDNAQAMGQIRAMIVQRDIPVIQALHPAEPQLLKAYGQAFGKEVAVEDVRQILDLYVEQVDQAPYEAIKQYLFSLEGGPDAFEASRFEPSYVPAILSVQGSIDPEKGKVLSRILEEGASVFDAKIRRAIEEGIAGARFGKTTKTIILNDNNPVVRTIRDRSAQGEPLVGVLSEAVVQIYHIAQGYVDVRIADSPRYYEHRNYILTKLLETDQLSARLQSERDQLALSLRNAQAELAQLKQHGHVPATMERRDCAMLLTDLKGSTRIVAFADSDQSADIMQNYANQVKDLIVRYGGRIERFTGDGIFAHFGTEIGNIGKAAAAASECAFEILGLTNRYFTTNDKVKNTLLKAAGITIDGSRTVLHYGEARFGEIAGAPALVGRQVVALFRASDKDELFQKCPIIITGSFHALLGLAKPLEPLATDIMIDEGLPRMTFYPHPALADSLRQ